MDNDTRPINDEVAKSEPMASSQEQPVSETKEVVGESVSTPKVTESEPTLPDEAKDRTKQEFEKLKSELRSVKQQLNNYVPKPSNYQTPSWNAPAPTKSLIESAYDPVTGQIDISALTKMEQELNSTKQALNEVKMDRQAERDHELEQAAESKYPELKTDKVFQRQVKSYLLYSMVHPEDFEGKELTPLMAAELIKGGSTKDVEAARKAGSEEAITALTPKEQAALEAQGRSDKRTRVVDMPSLAERSRRGDVDAIMERFKNIPGA